MSETCGVTSSIHGPASLAEGGAGWPAQLRRLRRQLRLVWQEPHRVLGLLGCESRPYECAACGGALAAGSPLVYSERFDGLVDPDCARIPLWIRQEPHAVRLLWLRAEDAPAAGRRPARFCLETALRGL